MASFTHYRVNTDNLHPVLQGTKDEEGTFLEDLLHRLKINIISLNDDDVEFDLIGVDASIANALRRIMLAEVLHLDFMLSTVSSSSVNFALIYLSHQHLSLAGTDDSH